MRSLTTIIFLPRWLVEWRTQRLVGFGSRHLRIVALALVVAFATIVLMIKVRGSSQLDTNRPLYSAPLPALTLRPRVFRPF